jgi:glycerol-3-phosphate cytidylyltransferase
MLNQNLHSKVPVVYTGGTFDLPHHGHFRLLQRASEFGKVVVGLNTDEFIFEYKKNSPIMSFDERKEILLACRWVDEVVPNYGGSDSKIAIDIVKPDYIIIGSDWARKDYYNQMGFDQDWLDERGIGLIYVPYTTGISSTDLKKRIGIK